MRQFAVVFALLPLLASSYYMKIGILSHDLDPDTTKKIWSMAQNYSTMMSLEPVVEMAQWKDIDNAAKFSRSICSLVKKGVDALVYVGSPRWNAFISSYATHIGLPFVAAGVNSVGFGQNEVCMLPDTTEAAGDIIIRYGWKNFIFFYDSDNGPDQLQKVLSYLLSVEFLPRVDGFWKIDSVSQATYYLKYLPPVMRQHFLLATSDEIADALMNSVDKSDVLLMTPVGTIKNTSHRRENTLIKFSVVDVEDPVLIALENRLKTLSSFIGRGKPGKDIPDSAILHYDSSSALDATFNKIAREIPAAMKSRNAADCFDISKDTSVATDFLKKVYVEHGATGKIAFDEKGRRHNYKLNIMQSTLYGDIEKVGTWTDKRRLQMIREPTGASSSPTYASYKNDTRIRVTSIMEAPFLQKYDNGTFFGFVVDFLDELTKEIKMDYDLQTSKDGKYGHVSDITGEWVGMIGEVLRKEVDIIVADLTKTPYRERVIDFSKNIMSSGLNILLKKTESDTEFSSFAPFTFLSVWSAPTWLALFVAVAVFAAGSYGISRFIGSPDRVRALESKGTDNLSPCGSVWFTVGSLFCRDTGIYPRYITHRLWALLWWLFCIFVGLTYVSMLTAALVKVRSTVGVTHSRKTSQEILKEYVETGLPVVGTLYGGSTMQTFKNSQVGLYQQFGKILKDHPETMAASYDEGVERVRQSNGKYAFVMEAQASEFVVNQEPCDTLVSSGYLVTRPYAVAFAKNSSLKEIIDHGVLSLMETGRLRHLYEKWWHRETANCEDPALNILPKVYNTAMTLHEVSGVFYLFILFSLLSVAAAAAEFYIRSRNIIVR